MLAEALVKPLLFVAKKGAESSDSGLFGMHCWVQQYLLQLQRYLRKLTMLLRRKGRQTLMNKTKEENTMKKEERVNLVEAAGIIGGGAVGVNLGSRLAQEILLNHHAYNPRSSLILETIGGILVGSIGATIGLGSSRIINH